MLNQTQKTAPFNPRISCFKRNLAVDSVGERKNSRYLVVFLVYF
jgi:hypothetical protein